MAVDLPLTQMSIEDKIQAMELLWSELSKTPEQVVSLSWHGEELHRRRQQIQDGTASFQNWASAIAELKAELHGYQAY
ncbi:addiction module protein [Synechococcus sp. CS-1331]|nr:addiction module protein [Synechococcus sp. CS-1331]